MLNIKLIMHRDLAAQMEVVDLLEAILTKMVEGVVVVFLVMVVLITEPEGAKLALLSQLVDPVISMGV